MNLRFSCVGPALTPYWLITSCASLQATCLLLLSHLPMHPVENLNIRLSRQIQYYTALPPITSTNTCCCCGGCRCAMNNAMTQNVLSVRSLLILYNFLLHYFSLSLFSLWSMFTPPTPSLPPFSLSLSCSVQEWCLSLRLCAPATSTPTLSCTWTWARTLGCSREKMPRSESTTHPETKTRASIFARFSKWIGCSSSLPLSVCRTCTSSCLSPTAWSIWICLVQIAPWTLWVT